ncbi:acyl carrier protein [Streptomyces sp. NPDC006668]|uniref:acyl carrier protein n=1 Tax=Streptomyces sp. NPDC006668 TaxID=3156903 RepID=UPI0010551CAE
MTDVIREFVISALGEMNYDTDEITGDTVLGPEGLDMESLAVAELAVRLEDEFGVGFADEEMAEFRTATLDRFVAAVARRLDPAMENNHG